MAITSACPDVSILQQLALGKMAPAEVEILARHCEECPRCIQTLHSLKLGDTLIEAMAAQRTQRDASCDIVANTLIERLKHLPVPVSPRDMTTTLGEEALPSGDTAGAFRANAPAEEIVFAPARGPDEIGRLGGYRVLKMLGCGGMGMVYQAEDVQLQRPIALKVMKPDVAQNPDNRERFLREARAAAKLKSDYVVTIHHVGQERNIVFLAMEFLEGLSLNDWLKKDRKPTLAQAARIGRQIALGLADAHSCDLIHRDIKPANVWLDSRHQGRVKLLDFGLARGLTEDVHLTQSGAILGTPAFMAPEQARGERVDHRADLFSLGVVLYRLTTGQLPFRGDNTMSILMSLAVDTPLPPRQINPAISSRMAALIESLLAKDRSKRPTSAKAVAEELAAIEREAVPPARQERTEQPGRSASVSDSPSQTAQVSEPPAPIVSVREWLAPTAPSRPRLGWIAAAVLFVLVSSATIVVIIRDKDGEEVARFDVPKGGKVEIVDDAKGKDSKKEKSKPKPEVRIEPEPLAPLAANQPLSASALVSRPAKLAGVRSWSIVQRETGIPSAVAYRPDGKWLAVGSWGWTVHLWHAKSGRLMRVLLPQGGVGSLAWSPDGRVLAVGTGGADRVVELWEVETGRRLHALETSASDFIFSLAWSPDGRKVRAWGASGHGYTWDAIGGKRLSAPSIPSQCERPAFSPDGRRLAGTMDNKRIVIWDVDTGRELSRWYSPAAVRCLVWSPDGKRLACTGEDGLRVWDVENRKDILHHPRAVSPDGPPLWSPDGRTLAFSLDNNQGTELLDVESIGEPRRLAEGGNCWMAWSPDSARIARINGEPWVKVYDVVTGERVLQLTKGTHLLGFGWSPGEQKLSVTDRFDTLLVSADSGQLLGEMKQATGPATWSPDGKLLAAQGPDNTLQLWQSNGKFHLRFADYKAEITSLTWSPDGKRLASTAEGEKRWRIWDAVKGERDRELGPFAGIVQNVKWSADGRLLTFNVPEIGWHI